MFGISKKKRKGLYFEYLLYVFKILCKAELNNKQSWVNDFSHLRNDLEDRLARYYSLELNIQNSYSYEKAEEI